MAIRRTLAEFSDDIATADIADDAITTAKILNSNVTAAKVASDVATTAGTQTLTNKTLTSPTLTTPALGTPSAVVLTSASGVLPVGVTGGLGLTGNEPAFSATAGTGTACASGSYTQIAHDTETYDKGGCYNNTASTVTLNGISVPSYAFLPNVAGTYHITARLFIPDLGNGLAYVPSIYKNGAARANVWSNQGGVQNICMPVIADLEANGTSDYFQIYIYHNHGSSRTSGTGITYAQFSAFRITGT